MKKILDILAEIADLHLNIPTLRTRRSDSLDFHEVSVWAVKSALRAAYNAGTNTSAQNGGQAAIVREMREALERAEFLMRRVHGGDHQALENLASAAKQARRVLDKAKPAKTSIDESPAELPIVTIEVRGGLIEDMDATIPVHVVIEDWDITDDDTGTKPARSVWTLTGGLSGPKAEKLRRVAVNA